MADWTQYNFDSQDCDTMNCIKYTERRPGIIERVEKSMRLVENQPTKDDGNKTIHINPLPQLVRRKGFIERVEEYEQKKKETERLDR